MRRGVGCFLLPPRATAGGLPFCDMKSIETKALSGDTADIYFELGPPAPDLPAFLARDLRLADGWPTNGFKGAFVLCQSPVFRSTMIGGIVQKQQGSCNVSSMEQQQQQQKHHLLNIATQQ